MAYAIKGLLEKLEAEGLALAEEALIKVLNVTSDWAEEEAKKAEHGLVDVGVLAVVPQAKALLTKQIDKIDGVQNQ